MEKIEFMLPCVLLFWWMNSGHISEYFSLLSILYIVGPICGVILFVLIKYHISPLFTLGNVGKSSENSEDLDWYQQHYQL